MIPDNVKKKIVYISSAYYNKILIKAFSLLLQDKFDITINSNWYDEENYDEEEIEYGSTVFKNLEESNIVICVYPIDNNDHVYAYSICDKVIYVRPEEFTCEDDVFITCKFIEYDNKISWYNTPKGIIVKSIEELFLLLIKLGVHRK